MVLSMAVMVARLARKAAMAACSRRAAWEVSRAVQKKDMAKQRGI